MKENKTPEILFFSSNFCEPCKEVEKLIHKNNISMFGKKLKIQKIPFIIHIAIKILTIRNFKELID